MGLVGWRLYSPPNSRRRLPLDGPHLPWLRFAILRFFLVRNMYTLSLCIVLGLELSPTLNECRCRCNTGPELTRLGASDFDLRFPISRLNWHRSCNSRGNVLGDILCESHTCQEHVTS